MKRRDIIILAIVLIASLTLYLLRPKPMDDSAAAYLQISIAGQARDLIPLTEEREIRIEQENGDYNVIRIFPGGFKVIEANCYNQDCIHQGGVTVDNIADRVLANEIICLPHKLVLSLVTGDETVLELAP